MPDAAPVSAALLQASRRLAHIDSELRLITRTLEAYPATFPPDLRCLLEDHVESVQDTVADLVTDLVRELLREAG